MQLNAIAVAVNTGFKGSEVADIVSRSGAKSIIFWPLFKKANFLEVLNSVADAAFNEIESVIIYDEEEHDLKSNSLLPSSFYSKSRDIPGIQSTTQAQKSIIANLTLAAIFLLPLEQPKRPSLYSIATAVFLYMPRKFGEI